MCMLPNWNEKFIMYVNLQFVSLFFFWVCVVEKIVALSVAKSMSRLSPTFGVVSTFFILRSFYVCDVLNF